MRQAPGGSGSFLSTQPGALRVALQKDFLVKKDTMVTSWPCLDELEKTASFLCPSESAKDDTDFVDGLWVLPEMMVGEL